MGNHKMITINDNEVSQVCGMCGDESYIKLTDEELGAFKNYLMGGLLIQECLPALNRCEREFLKSGYCTRLRQRLDMSSVSLFAILLVYRGPLSMLL